jgi:hypothetical protein
MANEIKRIGGVERASPVMGRWDIVAVVEVADLETLHYLVPKISSLPGFEGMEILVGSPLEEPFLPVPIEILNRMLGRAEMLLEENFSMEILKEVGLSQERIKEIDQNLMHQIRELFSSMIDKPLHEDIQRMFANVAYLLTEGIISILIVAKKLREAMYVA